MTIDGHKAPARNMPAQGPSKDFCWKGKDGHLGLGLWLSSKFLLWSWGRALGKQWKLSQDLEPLESPLSPGIRGRHLYSPCSLIVCV